MGGLIKESMQILDVRRCPGVEARTGPWPLWRFWDVRGFPRLGLVWGQDLQGFSGISYGSARREPIPVGAWSRLKRFNLEKLLPNPVEALR